MEFLVSKSDKLSGYNALVTEAHGDQVLPAASQLFYRLITHISFSHFVFFCQQENLEEIKLFLLIASNSAAQFVCTYRCKRTTLLV